MAAINRFPYSIDRLTTPAFCVDRKLIEKSCDRMLETATKHGVQLRAHMKTHKTVEGGIMMTGGSKRCIVVSTLAEAEFYADAGFDDILYGFPLTPEKIPSCLALSNRLEQFHLFIDNEIILDALADSPNPKKGWSIFLKVDCGNGRAGVHYEDTKMAAGLIEKMSNHENLRYAGIYVHCGNSYKGSSDDVTNVEKVTIERLLAFVKTMKDLTGIACPRFGIGSTPSCCQPVAELKTISEIHPGNYAFYDAQQFTLGSCKKEEIACWIVTRVIGHYPRRNELLIDCGFAALTKQGTGQLPSGCVLFKGEHNLKLLDATQEIGKVTTVDGQPLDYDKYPIGSRISMYPWHSCATAALHPTYYIVDGDKVVEHWTPCRGW